MTSPLRGGEACLRNIERACVRACVRASKITIGFQHDLDERRIFALCLDVPSEREPDLNSTVKLRTFQSLLASRESRRTVVRVEISREEFRNAGGRETGRTM